MSADGDAREGGPGIGPGIGPGRHRQRARPDGADVLLSDGTLAVIRPVEATDRAGLDRLHEEASAEDLQKRFFTIGHRAGRLYVAHIFSDDPPLRTLVMTVAGDIIGVATAESTATDGRVEVAFLVSESGHGRGAGGLLLEHLAASARAMHVAVLSADVLFDNQPMLHVLRTAGFASTSSTSQGVTRVELSTVGSTRSTDRADAREFISEASSLGPLLRPRCVAVAAAGSDAGEAMALVRRIRTGGFAGELLLIHSGPTEEIDGCVVHPRLADLRHRVDVLVATAPPAEVLELVRSVGPAGVSTLVVRAAQRDTAYAPAEQHELARLTRLRGIRLVGPDSLGVLVGEPAHRLDLLPDHPVILPGALAVACQSRVASRLVLTFAAHHGLAVGAFVSLGDKAGVSGNDLLAAWSLDSATTAVALHLESLGNPAKFARFARRVASTKPLLVTVAGMSPTEQAVLGHTGAVVCGNAWELVARAVGLDNGTGDRPPLQHPPPVGPDDDGPPDVAPRQLRPLT